MNTPITVEASAVRVGDRIYNSRAYAPSAAWLEVREVSTSGNYIVIETAVFSLWLHPREGIAVQRKPDEQQGIGESDGGAV